MLTYFFLRDPHQNALTLCFSSSKCFRNNERNTSINRPKRSTSSTFNTPSFSYLGKRSPMTVNVHRSVLLEFCLRSMYIKYTTFEWLCFEGQGGCTVMTNTTGLWNAYSCNHGDPAAVCYVYGSFPCKISFGRARTMLTEVWCWSFVLGVRFAEALELLGNWTVNIHVIVL